MNIASALRLAQNILIESHTKHLDAELLLAYVLKKDRVEVISYPELILSDQQYLDFHRLLSIRAHGKSIAQILGEQEFWGRPFMVSDHTLVPRADSETLISVILKLYKKRKSAFKVGDFGTGTGCLVITILLEYLNANGIAFEKSHKAYQIASANRRKYNLLSRLKIVFGSWEKCTDSLDLIISNPPYIRKNDIPILPTTIRDYEPRIALDGGQNGLDCYFSILKVAKRHLKKTGYLVVEVGDDNQLRILRKVAPIYGLNIYKVFADLAGSIRCVVFHMINS